MKNLILISALAIMVLTGCEKQNPQRVYVPDTTSSMPDLANDEVVVHEESPRYLSRGQAEPDFWNPAYRSNKILNVYVEVSNDLCVAWGNQTDANVAKLFQNASDVMERIAGPRIRVVRVKKWLTPDPYAGINSSGTILNQWANSGPNRVDTFSVFITGRNIGGTAYINRENVVSTKYAVCGLAGYGTGDALNFSFSVFCIDHELLHSLGVSHSQNCCAWKDKNGVALGRLDSCYSAEVTCSPAPAICSSTTKSMNGGLNGYCHLYGRTGYFLHPAVLPVLHRSLFYSNLPAYTPTIPVTPSVVIAPSGYQVSGGASHSGLTSYLFDGITNTNVSRYLLKDSMIVNVIFGGQKLDSVQLFTGFLSGGVWTSPVARVSILRNGVWTTNVTNNPAQKGYSLGGVSTTAVRIKFGPADFARVREIVFWGKP